MPSSFEKKVLKVTVILAEGDFGGGNALEIPGAPDGLAMTVSVDKPGQPDNNKASITVQGLSLEHMAEMTTLGFGPQEMQKNLVKVEAGTGDASSVIFEGEITEAWADFNSAPDPEMKIEAESGAYPQILSEDPLSVAGEAGVAGLAEQEANAMGYSFKNEGVTASVRNGVYTGSPMAKLRAMADETGCELIVDDREVLLLPGDGSARTGNAVLVNADSGELGYPTFTQDGVSFKCLFNPELKQGGLVRLESVVPKATGTWKITKLSHKISSFEDWTSEVEAEHVG
jgi:hypothetical protein